MTNHWISRRQSGRPAPRGLGTEAKQARARAVAMLSVTTGAAMAIPASATMPSAQRMARRLLIGLAISGPGSGREVQPAVGASELVCPDFGGGQERVAPAACLPRPAGAPAAGTPQPRGRVSGGR